MKLHLTEALTDNEKLQFFRKSWITLFTLGSVCEHLNQAVHM